MPEQAAIATNQRRYLLLEAIRRMSRTRSWVTQRDLLADLRGQGYDIYKHQILRDLKALAAIHTELECHDNADAEGNPRAGIEYGYRWVSRNPTPETGLSIPEALSLVLVSRHLKQALPASLSGTLQSLFERAETTLTLQQKHSTARWKDLVGIVSPTQPMLPPKISAEIINVVHGALLSEEQIQVTYRNAKNEEEKFTLHPLGIMIREPSIYLIAVVDGHDDPRMFALHRIPSAQRTHMPVSRPGDFVLSDYLETQGNFGLGKLITLKGRVCRHLGMILEETPLSPNQKLGQPDADGWRDLDVKVRDNWQLKWWLLSEGDRIVIKSPLDIRSSLISTASSVISRYKGK